MPANAIAKIPTVRSGRMTNEYRWSSRSRAQIFAPGSDSLLAEPLHSQSRDLPRVFEFQLFLNVGPVGLDRFWTHSQCVRNFVHFMPFADQLENLEFAVG